MNVKKMKEIFSDEEFVKSMLELETVAEVQAALKEKGIELSEEEILGIRELFIKVESGEITQEQLAGWQKQAEDGELSDETLEQVAGGLGPITGALVLTGAVIALFVGIPLVDYLTRRRW